MTPEERKRLSRAILVKRGGHAGVLDDETDNISMADVTAGEYAWPLLVEMVDEGNGAAIRRLPERLRPYILRISIFDSPTWFEIRGATITEAIAVAWAHKNRVKW